MPTYDDMSPQRTIARVKAAVNDGRRLLVELPNGHIVTIDSEIPFHFRDGTILLISAEDNHVEEAPANMWPASEWTGVVKKRLEDVDIVDVGHLLRTVPKSGIHCDVGNTVLGSDIEGVTRVLSLDPIGTIDVPALSNADVARFRQPEGNCKTSFEDFGGLDDVVARAHELVEINLKSAEQLQKVGVRPVKGVLFTGLPGTGKTLLARIIADSTRAAFYEIAGPEFLSKWYGQSPQLLRMIFDEAARQDQAVIFFDEIDSIAGSREGDTHEESRRVVAQLLTLMDGFESSSRVLVIATTNRPQDIDEALRRPGRFDLEIYFRMPHKKDREAILVAAARHVARVDAEYAVASISELTDGWSAAELSAIWREAGVLAVKDDRSVVIPEDFYWGYVRVREQRAQIRAEGRNRRGE